MWVTAREKRAIDLYEHLDGRRTTTTNTKAAKLFINEPLHIISGEKWCRDVVIGRPWCPNTLMEVILTSQNGEACIAKCTSRRNLTELSTPLLEECYRTLVWVHMDRINASVSSICLMLVYP